MDTGGFAMYIETVLSPWWLNEQTSWTDPDLIVRIPGSRPGIMWTCIVRVTGIMSTMIPGEGIQHACGQFEHAIDSVNLARVKRKEKKRGETWFPFNFV
jgi:hypothetical protein